MKKQWRTSVVVALVSIGALSACERWVPDLVSVNAAGTGGGNSWSSAPVLSPDGTKVAFFSQAGNFGPTDTRTCTTQITRPCQDVYLRDLETGTTTLISRNVAGTNGGNFDSATPVFSPDGTKIAFQSKASDLVTTPAVPDNANYLLYLHDLTTGTTSLISTDEAGTGPGSDWYYDPVFTADSSKVAYWGLSGDVFLKDLSTGTRTLVSVNAAGTGGGAARSLQPQITPDGTKIVFGSRADDLGPPDYSSFSDDIFVRDLALGRTSLVSYRADRRLSANGESISPVLSPDGSKVAFLSNATNLGVPDDNFTYDLYTRDINTGELWRIPLQEPEEGGLYGVGYAFSPDSSEIVFNSWAELLPGDFNGRLDVHVLDLATDTYERITEGPQTGGANGDSRWPSFNADGTQIVFESTASDLIQGTDTNGVEDIFVHDRTGDATFLVSSRSDGNNTGNGASTEPRFGGNDRIVFTSYASDLSVPSAPGDSDVFVAEWREPDAG